MAKIVWPKLTKKAARALRGSIKKWEGIVAGTIEDEGPDNCPLCKAYMVSFLNCGNCPLAVFDPDQGPERGGCAGTPYMEYDPYSKDKGMAAAKKELRFLRNVLKHGEQK